MKIQIQKGLGDALYNYPIIKGLAKQNEIELETQYPELFAHLPNVKASKDELKGVDLKLRFYVMQRPAYDQLCLKAGVAPEFDLTDLLGSWSVIPPRAICVVKEPCASGYVKEKGEMKHAADHKEMQTWIEKNRDKYYFISVGQNEKYTERLKVDLDLTDKLSVFELISLCSNASAIITQVGHLIPLACAFNVPLKVFKSIGDSDKMYELRKNCTVIKGKYIELG